MIATAATLVYVSTFNVIKIPVDTRTIWQFNMEVGRPYAMFHAGIKITCALLINIIKLQI